MIARGVGDLQKVDGRLNVKDYFNIAWRFIIEFREIRILEPR